MPDHILQRLNPEQQRVVTTTHGPVLVIAGAGSGKTRALTHRIAYLIAAGHAAPQNILAVTFTNKAAKEMAHRVAELLPNPTTAKPSIGTFHSISARILREQHRHLDRTASFDILDTADSERVVREVLKRQGVSSRQWTPRAVRSTISTHKRTGALPTTDLDVPGDHDGIVLAAWQAYEKRLRELNAYDFDDLISRSVELLTTTQAVRESYQRRWRFILVDEYQDTDPQQVAFVSLMLGPEQNLCVVGDDYQAIYSWRGANVEHILEFPKQFPAAVTLYLTQNYRSSGAILEAANSVIATNEQQFKKALWTEAASGAPVEVIATVDDHTEAATVRHAISTLASGARSGGNSVAVLYRTNAQSRLFEEEFIRHNIAYTIIGGVRFYQRAEVKDAVALVQLLHNPNAELALQRVGQRLVAGAGPKTIARITEAWRGSERSLQQVLADDAVLSARQRTAWQPIVRALAEAAEQPRPTDAVATLIERSGLTRVLAAQPDGSERAENLDQLISLAAEYDTIAALLEAVALMSDIDEAPDDTTRVLCMTLHAAKGLEFDHVFVAGIEEELLPHRSAAVSSADVEEERRLLYVGMTRARHHLTLLHADARVVHGERRASAPSRFLDELPVNVSRSAHDASSTPSERESELVDAWDVGQTHTAPVTIGATITHQHFGEGVVISATDSAVTCVFEGHGVKVITPDHIEHTA